MKGKTNKKGMITNIRFKITTILPSITSIRNKKTELMMATYPTYNNEDPYSDTEFESSFI